MRIREGIVTDIPSLWALRTRCVREICSSHYSADVIATWSASPPPERYPALMAAGGCRIAENDAGALLGFGVIDMPGNEIDALFVDPDRGGQGIGVALMQALEALADPARELVLSASLNAVPFYQRAGFLVLGEESYPHVSGITLAAVRMFKPPR